MIFNVDSMKPILLVDISMNNYANIVFKAFSEYDKQLPDGQKNGYYIAMYREYENRFMKRFFRTVKEVSKDMNDDSIEDISYNIMDSFEEYIKEKLDNLENVLEEFLEKDKNDPDNIFLLRKIIVNSVVLQLADKMNNYYNGKRDNIIVSLMETNTLFIEKLDDRKVKREYNTKELEKAVVELILRVKDFKYEKKEQQ